MQNMKEKIVIKKCHLGGSCKCVEGKEKSTNSFEKSATVLFLARNNKARSNRQTPVAKQLSLGCWCLIPGVLDLDLLPPGDSTMCMVSLFPLCAVCPLSRSHSQVPNCVLLSLSYPDLVEALGKTLALLSVLETQGMTNASLLAGFYLFSAVW